MCPIHTLTPGPPLSSSSSSTPPSPTVTGGPTDRERCGTVCVQVSPGGFYYYDYYLVLYFPPTDPSRHHLFMYLGIYNNNTKIVCIKTHTFRFCRVVQMYLLCSMRELSNKFVYLTSSGVSKSVLEFVISLETSAAANVSVPSNTPWPNFPYRYTLFKCITR